MNFCPTDDDLQHLLRDKLPHDLRASVEGHVEACPRCQHQLEALTQAGELQLAPSHATIDTTPAFLAKLQSDYPATLLDAKAATIATLHFPSPPSDCAPLGQVGDFEILEELGSGSFGWVFRAHERSLDRIVALKVLKPEMTARPDALTRFEREARKASLKHDHIVSVHRFEKQADFPPYLVMEFVEGETLEARLKREGRLTPEAAAAIARQVALGLSAAHERGMVHRDIKPANILLDRITGRAKISDFGLARDIIDESMAVTNAGELAGTAPYMSPEHFLSPEKVDGRSDLFSLGIVLYQMLTGELPFKGSFLQLRSGILEDEPTAPRRLNDGIPADLETITLACLEKDPQRRYATGQALAEDLRRYQNGEPILFRPAGPIERAVKWIQRKPAQAGLIALGSLAACILGIVIAGAFVNAKLQQANNDLTQAKSDLDHTHGKLLDEQKYVKRLNYIADMNLAHQAWQNDNFHLLDQFLATYEESNLRGFEWHYLRRLANVDGRRIGPINSVSAMAIDIRGERLAFSVPTARGGEIQVWRRPSRTKLAGELQVTLPHADAPVSDLVFHPIASWPWLVSADEKGVIRIWDLDKVKLMQSLNGNGPLAIDVHGRWLAFVGPDGTVRRWSFVDRREFGLPLAMDFAASADGDKGKGRGKPTGATPDRSDKNKGIRVPASDRTKPANDDATPGAIKQLAFSPDGNRLAAVGGRYSTGGSLVVWDLRIGDRLPFDDSSQSDIIASVAFSPDGRSIATGGYDHALRVWDARTGKLRFRRLAHKLEILSVAFDSTGTQIATAGWDKTVRLWNAETGEERRSLHGSRSIVQQVAFCSNTDQSQRDNLVSLNVTGEVRWWDAEHDQTALVTKLNEPAQALAFSPTGRFLAIFGRNRQALVSDLSQPGKRYDLTISTPSAGVFSADEKHLFIGTPDATWTRWRFENGSDTTALPGFAQLAGHRLVTYAERKWVATSAYPTAESAKEKRVHFGTAFLNESTKVMTIDASGERLAIFIDGKVEMRRRNADGSTISLVMPTNGVGVNALAFSPDGGLLAAGGQDNSILLWDTTTGKLKHHLTGHLCFVSCVAFSPNGKRLVSGSEDWTVKIWDIDVGRATLTLSGHTGRIRDLAFSPDGNFLASASEDATVRLWVGAGKVVEALPRDLAPENVTTKLIRGK